MTRKPVVILHARDPGRARDILARDHPDLNFHGCDSYEALPACIAETGAEVIYSVRFGGTFGYPRDAILASDTVKWVSVAGSGTDHLLPWDTARVTVTNAAGVAADMMAEYVLGTILSVSLDLRGYHAAQRAHRWFDGRMEPIAGRTALILGLGKTGQAVARRLKAMGLTTLGVRARPQPTANLDEVHGMTALPGLWPRADYVICCVPLLDSTTGLVNAAAFAALKPGAMLVDVSRGGVVSETALIGALKSGRLGAAALDVFAVEPLSPESPLWGMDNVVITPHSSAVYDAWDLNSAAMFSENLTRYRAREPLRNVVDPKRGY